MKAKWIVRIVVGVVLLALLALAGLDYLAKSQATETAEAWDEMIKNDKVEFAPDEYVKGSPEIRTEKAAFNNEKLTYTWPGILRDYRVELVCIGPASNKDGKRFIQSMEGPLSN